MLIPLHYLTVWNVFSKVIRLNLLIRVCHMNLVLFLFQIWFNKLRTVNFVVVLLSSQLLVILWDELMHFWMKSPQIWVIPKLLVHVFISIFIKVIPFWWICHHKVKQLFQMLHLLLLIRSFEIFKESILSGWSRERIGATLITRGGILLYIISNL